MQIENMNNIDWNETAKRILKAELVKRGITNEMLAGLLNNFGFDETKQSVESKIYRGTFSAAFLFQCLTVMNCKTLNTEIDISKPTKRKK